MCSNVVVIASIGSQDSAQMRLAQDDEMVNTLAPDRSDQPFGKAGHRAGRSRWSGQQTGPSQQYLGHGCAGRCATPGLAARAASPCIWRRLIERRLEQFAVNAWRPPKRVLDAHSPDQRAQVRFDLRTPS